MCQHNSKKYTLKHVAWQISNSIRLSIIRVNIYYISLMREIWTSELNLKT